MDDIGTFIIGLSCGVVALIWMVSDHAKQYRYLQINEQYVYCKGFDRKTNELTGQEFMVCKDPKTFMLR